MRRRVWLAAAGGVALAMAAVFALLHTPPVRARALDALIARLAQAGIAARAERLDYNLATLEVRVRGLSLATPAALDAPFLTADEARIVLGWGVLRGRVDIARVEAQHPRVVLRRDDRGAVNWPKSSSGGSSIDSVDLQAVDVSDLDVAWRDDLARVAAEARAFALHLTPAAGGATGTLRLGAPARVQWDDRATTIEALEAGVTWNGRDLALSGLRAQLPEGLVAIDGHVDRLLGDRGTLGLRVTADADLVAIARLARADPAMGPLAGAMRVEATVDGPLTAPRANITVNGREIRIAGLDNITLRAAGEASTDQTSLTTIEARVAGGTIAGRGNSSLSTGAGEMHVEWRGLDLATFTRRALDGAPLAARMDGSIDGRWSALRADALVLSGRAQTRPPAEPPARATPIEGSIAFELEKQQWGLRVEETLDRNVQARAELSGAVAVPDVAQSTVTGVVRVNAPDVDALAATLARVGLVATAPKIDGSAQGEFAVSGTIAEPRFEGTLESRLRYADVGPLNVTSHAVLTRTAVELGNVDGRLGENVARGDIRLATATRQIAGRVDIAIKRLDALGGVLPPAVRAEGTLDLHAVLSGSTAAPRADVEVTSGGFTMAGQRVDRADARLRMSGPAITVERIRLDSGEGRLEGSGHVDLERRTYVAHATAKDFPIEAVPGASGEVTAPVAARATGQIDGEGSFEWPAGRGRLTFADARWADARLGTIETDLTARDRRVSIDIRAPDLQLTGSAEGGIDSAAAISARGRWEPGDVAALATRLGWSPPFPLSGSGTLRFEISGPQAEPDNLHVTTDLERIDLRVDGTAVRLDRPGQIEYAARAIRVRDVALSVGSSHLTIAGAMREGSSEEIVATLQGSAADFEFVEHLARQSGPGHSDLSPPQGSITATVVASGSPVQPALAGAIRVTGGRVPLTAAATVEGANLDATYERGVLRLADLHAAFAGATLTARGEVPADLFRDRIPQQWRELIPVSGRPATLTAEVSSITQQAAAPFVDAAVLQSVAGHVDAAIDLRADAALLDRVAGTIALTRADLTVAGVSLDQQAPTRLRVHDGRIDVEAWEWGGGDNHITLTGGVSLAGDQALALEAKTTLDVGVVNAFTSAGRVAGRADGDIRIGGTMADPLVDGYLTFANGELRVADPKLVVADLTGTVTFNRDALTLERMYATVNGGGTEIAGSVHHRWFSPLDGQITFRSRDAALDLSGLRAEANADLTLAIARRAAGQQATTIAGTVTVLRGTYREPLSLTTGVLQALRSPAAAVSPQRSALDDVRLDVRIATQSDLLVDNNYAKLAASADVRLVGTLAQPAAVGRAALGEGGIVYFGGRRYRLDRQGSIDFANTARIEPNVDLSAVTRVGTTDITLTLNGTPATLTPKLTTPDPLLTQTDLISLLVTGRTDAERAAAGDYGSRELIGYLSADLVGAAGRAVGLDTLRVEQGNPDVRFDAGLVATETDPGARLTFGKNIGRAQVVISQSLRDEGGTTWIVSYAPRSALELRAVSLDNGDRLYGFRHDLVFGAGTRRARARPPEAPRVRSIQIAGAGADEAALRGRLTLREGDRFSFFRWQDDRDRLEEFYQQHDRATARVRTRRVEGETADPRSVGLLYDVAPGPRTAIVVDGASLPDRVVSAMKLAWTRSVVDAFLIDEVVALAKSEMLERGFVRASASARLEGGADARTLRVAIDPGPRFSERRVDFRGNERIARERLVAALADAGAAPAVWLDPAAAADALTAFYHREGFLNATVTLDQIATDGSAATRVVRVEEGNPFAVRRLRIDGARGVPADQVRTLSGLSGGAAYSAAAVENARRAIVDGYRSRGFNNVGLTMRIDEAAAASEVDVIVTVDEGSQQRVRDVAIAGLKRTNPELVRRALRIEAGEPVNLADWAASRQRLYETGVFRSVDVQPEPMTGAAQSDEAATRFPPEQPVRARVTLTEWPPLRVQYGLEIDDQAKTPSGDASRITPSPAGESARSFGAGLAGTIGLRNLFGNAIGAGLAGRYTKDFRALRAYATAPTMFGRRLVTNAFVSISQEQVGAGVENGNKKFATNTLDLTLEQRWRPLARAEVSYGFSFQRNHTFDLEPDPDEIIPFDVLAAIARLRSTLLVDRRDDLVDASRGWFHSSDFEYAVPKLGSDTRFVKYLLQERYYRRFGRVVAASAARLGLATAFEETLLPTERFFAGGGNSVRGYGEDTLSPHDFLGAAIGGNALVVLNEEVRFPIYKWARGVGFFDAGRAFETVRVMSLGDLATSAGFGLRLQTPIVLLRFDAGVPLDTTFGSRRARWFFSIGQLF